MLDALNVISQLYSALWSGFPYRTGWVAMRLESNPRTDRDNATVSIIPAHAGHPGVNRVARKFVFTMNIAAHIFFRSGVVGKTPKYLGTRRYKAKSNLDRGLPTLDGRPVIGHSRKNRIELPMGHVTWARVEVRTQRDN